jgi:D-xylose 1-dehydrogenase (NADP+, D-xylono-1,5-lactone-forming)
MPEKVRWGVMSTANIGQIAVIPAIQKSKFGVVEALGSRDTEKAGRVAHALGISRVVDSYEALLKDPDIDAVYIPLPNSMHAEWTIRAAEAGKSVLCEKPLATSSEDVLRQIDACQKHGVRLMEAFMYRFHPQTRRVRELVASGKIGQVREVRAHLSVNIMRSMDPSNIRYINTLGGGALLDMGCYTVNICRMIFGREPERVIGLLQIDSDLGVDTGAAGILVFPDGVGMITCSFGADGQGAYTIVGTEGTIEVPRGIIPGLGTRVPEGLIVVMDADGNRHQESFEHGDHYRDMVDAFSKALLKGEPVPLPPEDGLKNLRVLEALVRSSATNSVEAV